ncbi:hypothetical protein B0H17DRAFT_1191773 [Mycena rosella]|uniref:Uncharacterized protein n=1 Tax=Mycena rosella TaxID=1033263 RepID=A0AAD7MAQ7_MYCRO|nr:hypothetical protein B0H17DRAFT_1191773 [Mycena rosella]
MDRNGDPAPFFPAELERQIFEFAAEIYPETIAPLLLVSHRVQDWIERIKYRTVITLFNHITCRIRPLQRAIRANVKPIGFFRECVRHLFIGIALSSEEMSEILAACSGVTSLAIIDDEVGPWALPSLATTQPRRLYVHLTNLFGGIPSLDLQHPMFGRLTHLELFDDDIADLPWPAFSALPALTHLALYQIRSELLVLEVFSTCARLTVLVDMRSRPPTLAKRLAVDDKRFVSIVVGDEDYGRDWYVGARGGYDFWVRADAFVAKKQRGEIKPSSRCWIEDGDGI